MTKLVTIFGGSGFVGRYIARRMAQAGWRVRVAVRRPNEAIFVKPYGTVGQVEPIGCNIRDDASVAAALSGADAVGELCRHPKRSGPQQILRCPSRGRCPYCRVWPVNMAFQTWCISQPSARTKTGQAHMPRPKPKARPRSKSIFPMR